MVNVAKPSDSGELVVVPFDLKANLIILDARVNDQPVRLVFDTGASQTLLDERSASRAGVRAVERRRARSAGGDIDVSVAGVESVAVGQASVSNLTCIVSDITGISEKLGGGIDGVLGFDFNSRFRITIDYVQRELTLEPTRPAGAPPAAIDGHRFVHAAIGLEVKRPDETWVFETATPYPQIVLMLMKDRESASVSIQSQELYGMTLAQLLPDLAESLSQQFDGLERINDTPGPLSANSSHRFDFRGERGGVLLQGAMVVAVEDDRLWTITCTAPPERFALLRCEFQQIIDSIQIKPARKVSARRPYGHPP